MLRRALLFAFCLGVCVPVQAQDDEQTDAELDPETEQAAREAFHLGRTAFADGRYSDAANYFQRSYDLSGHAELLFNLGVAHERLGHREKAIELFEQYLEERPDGEVSDQVQQRLSVLRSGVNEEGLEVVVADDGPGAGPWIVMGAGAVAAGIGTAFLILANSAAGSVDDVAEGEVFWDEVEGDADRAATFSALGGVMLGIAGAAVIGGLTWFLVGSGGSEQRVEVSLSPTGASIAGRF